MPKKIIAPSASLPFLGKILNDIYENGKPRFETKTKLSSDINVEQYLSNISQNKEIISNYIQGGLDVLKVLGLFTFDEKKNVQATSRYAHFAIGSLSKFLDSSVCVADEPINGDEEKYLVNLTSLLERMRTEVKKDIIDQTPLHYRRIVNVIVKGRQIRKGKETDVYLHVYHPEWRAYHLIGLSHKNTNETDDDVAQKAMETQLGLKPDQYELDNGFNPNDKDTVEISKTSGALTKYTYALRVAKKINVDLKLREWMEKGRFQENWFRWFTWEEIKERESFQNEPIIFSTPFVLEDVDLESLPLSAIKSEDARKHSSIRYELYQRFTLKQVYLFALLVAFSPLLWFTQKIIDRLGGGTIPLLENMANLFTVLGYIIPVVVAIFVYLSGKKK
jgi:hypothetical protein